MLRKKSTFYQMMILLILFLLLFPVKSRVDAKIVDVTEKYRWKVGSMLRPFDTFLGDGCLVYMHNDFNVYYRTGMVARINTGSGGSVYGMTPKQAGKRLKGKMKLYFGTTKTKFKKYPGYRTITSPAYSFQVKDGKLIEVYGQWGETDAPVGAVERIVQINPKNYRVTYKLQFFDYTSGRYGKEMGRYTIALKKAKNKNGFIITNVRRIATYLDNSY